MTQIMSRIENKLDGLGNRVTSLEARMYAHEQSDHIIQI